MTIGDAKIRVNIEWDEPTRKLLDALTAVTVVGPDDHLVLAFRHITRAQVEQLKAELRERYPALADRVVITGGEVELTVVRETRSKAAD